MTVYYIQDPRGICCLDNLLTQARVEGHVVPEPVDSGFGLGVGDLAGDLHLLVLLHVYPGAGDVVEDVNFRGRHCKRISAGDVL